MVLLNSYTLPIWVDMTAVSHTCSSQNFVLYTALVYPQHYAVLCFTLQVCIPWAQQPLETGVKKDSLSHVPWEPHSHQPFYRFERYIRHREIKIISCKWVEGDTTMLILTATCSALHIISGNQLVSRNMGLSTIIDTRRMLVLVTKWKQLRIRQGIKSKTDSKHEQCL